MWACCGQGDITLWHAQTRWSGKLTKPIKLPPAHKEDVRAILVVKADDASRSVVWTGDPSGLINVWSVKKKGKVSSKIKKIRINRPVESIYQYRDTIWVGTDGVIFVFNAKTHECIRMWAAHNGLINDMVCCGAYMWSCGQDYTICIWDPNDVRVHLAPCNIVACTLFSLNGHRHRRPRRRCAAPVRGAGKTYQGPHEQGVLPADGRPLRVERQFRHVDHHLERCDVRLCAGAQGCAYGRRSLAAACGARVRVVGSHAVRRPHCTVDRSATAATADRGIESLAANRSTCDGITPSCTEGRSRSVEV